MGATLFPVFYAQILTRGTTGDEKAEGRQLLHQQTGAHKALKNRAFGPASPAPQSGLATSNKHSPQFGKIPIHHV